MSSKKILITGGCGFVGINLCQKLKLKYPDYQIIAFDNLRRRGAELNIEKLKDLAIEFIHGDIRNPEDFEGIDELDLIIDASAEPSVVSGLDGGQNQLININLIGTLNILNLALKHKSQFIFLSTSRIYPIENINNIMFSENETRFQILKDQNLNGVSEKGIAESFNKEGYRSLYGASKLSSEHIITEYNHFFNLNTIVNRCGVLAGPHQMGKVDQGVAVLWLARHYWKKDLTYLGYGGEGKQVRDVLHIDDLFDLIDLQIHDFDLYNGQTFNVGGGQESSVSLQELTTICEEITGNQLNIKKVAEDRVADIRLYITDNTKISTISGWLPQRNPQKILLDIFDWVKTNEKSLIKILK
jgi:CDP-paratose 2-epimerase